MKWFKFIVNSIAHSNISDMYNLQKNQCKIQINLYIAVTLKQMFASSTTSSSIKRTKTFLCQRKNICARYLCNLNKIGSQDEIQFQFLNMISLTSSLPSSAYPKNKNTRLSQKVRISLVYI